MTERRPLVLSGAKKVQELQLGDTLPPVALPAATQVGDVLYSKDGATFTVEKPIVSIDGWLANADDELLVEGL